MAILRDSGCAAHELEVFSAQLPYPLSGAFNVGYNPFLKVEDLNDVGDQGTYVCSHLSTHVVEVLED
jgi:hypothetical protein